MDGAPLQQPQPPKAWRILLDGIVEDSRIVVPALQDVLLRTLFRRREPVLADVAALRATLVTHAQHLAQSSIYAYCRARTGFMAPKLFDEREFLDSLEVAKWESYAACLADITLIAEGQLRPLLSADSAARRELFTALYRDALTHYPVPAHRRDWNDAYERFAQRLAWALDNPPREPDDIAGISGQVVFDHLPVHPDMRRYDEEMVVNSVRFRTCRFAEDFSRRIDAPALSAAVAAAPIRSGPAPGNTL